MSAAPRGCRPSGPPGADDERPGGAEPKTIAVPQSPRPGRSQAAPKPGCRVAAEGGLAMEMHSPVIAATLEPAAELDRLGDEIADLSAHLEAATARLLDLIREFDARGGWNTGFRSCAAWLSWRVGLDPGAAREKVRVARALGTLPALAQALARGELSYAKVRALTRVATPGDRGAAAGGGAGRHGRPRRADRAGLAAGGPAGRGPRSRDAHAGRSLQVYPDEDGMVVLRGRLEPEVGALLLRALEAARETLYQQARGLRRRHGDPAAERPDPGPAAGGRAGPARGDGPPPRARSRRAGRAVPGGGPRRRPGAGGPGSARPVGAGGRGARFPRNVAAPGVRREPGGDAARPGRAPRGGRRPDPNDPARAAARAPPPGPRLPLPGLRAPVRPGASRPPLGARRPDHALEPRAALSPAPPRGPRGGLPRRTTARRRRSGSGGRTAGPCPRSRRRPRCPPIRSQALRAHHHAQGLRLHARTACPDWLGERLDLGWAIDVLHPLANPLRGSSTREDRPASGFDSSCRCGHDRHMPTCRERGES